jgi:hypothetical protein
MFLHGIDDIVTGVVQNHFIQVWHQILVSEGCLGSAVDGGLLQVRITQIQDTFIHLGLCFEYYGRTLIVYGSLF